MSMKIKGEWTRGPQDFFHSGRPPIMLLNHEQPCDKEAPLCKEDISDFTFYMIIHSNNTEGLSDEKIRSYP